MRTRYLRIAYAKKVGLDKFSSFSATGSVAGMKSKFYGRDALLVRSGSYIYNVTSKPEIYWLAK